MQTRQRIALGNTTALVVVPMLALTWFTSGAWQALTAALPPRAATAAPAFVQGHAVLKNFEETAQRSALTIARTEERSLEYTIKVLTNNSKRQLQGTFANILIRQELQQASYELRAIKSLLGRLEDGRLHGTSALNSERLLLSSFFQANSRLSSFQFLENRQGHASGYSFVQNF
jgi:hypothetical protein